MKAVRLVGLAGLALLLNGCEGGDLVTFEGSGCKGKLETEAIQTLGSAGLPVRRRAAEN